MKTPEYDVRIIPAQPGWDVLCPVTGEVGDDVVELSPDPVIAWQVEYGEGIGAFGYKHRSAQPYPITANGIVDVDDCLLLRRPDGMVEIPYVGTLNTETEGIKYLNDSDAWPPSTPRPRGE